MFDYQGIKTTDLFFLALHLSLAENLGCLTWVGATAAARAALPVPHSACVFFVCQKVWLPMPGIFNVHGYVHACNYT